MFMALALHSGPRCNVSRKYSALVCLIGYLNDQTNKPSCKLYGSQTESTVKVVDFINAVGSKVHFSSVFPGAIDLLWLQFWLKLYESADVSPN